MLINWFIFNGSHIISCVCVFFSTPTLQKNRKSNWHKTPDSLYYKWTTGKSIVLLCLHAINSFAPGKQLLMIWINTLPSPRFYSPLPSVFHLSPHLPANQFTQRDIAARNFPTFFFFSCLFSHSNMNPCESSYSCASLNSLSKPVCPAITVTWDLSSLPNQLVFSSFPRQKFCKGWQNLLHGCVCYQRWLSVHTYCY